MNKVASVQTQRSPEIGKSEESKTYTSSQKNQIALLQLLKQQIQKPKKKKRKRPKIDPSFKSAPPQKKQRFNEPNLAMEFTHLFTYHADPEHNRSMNLKLDGSAALIDGIDQSRILIQDLKAAKKGLDEQLPEAERGSFNFEKFKKDCAQFDAWLADTKERFPQDFKSINPLFDNLQKMDTKQFFSTIEDNMEKLHQMISSMQGQTSVKALEIEAAQKLFLLIAQIMVDGLQNTKRLDDTLTRAQRAAGG